MKYQNKILEYIRENKSPVTTDQVAKALDIAWQTAQMNLLNLANEEKIKFERIGRQNLFMKKSIRQKRNQETPGDGYKMLFEQSPRPMWIFDRESLEMLEVNSAALQLFGRQREEFLQLRAPDLLVGDQMDLLSLSAINKRPEIVGTRSRWSLQTSGGHARRDVFIRSAHFQNRLATLVQVMPTNLLEEQLRRSEEKFHLLVDAIQEYAIFMLDERGRVASWNKGAQRAKGWSAQEIIGKSYAIFFTPEDRDAGKPEKILKIAAETGTYHETGLRVRKDGKRFLADITLSAIKSADGLLLGFAKIMRDITEKRKIEELRRSEQELRVILEGINEGITAVTPAGAFIYANDIAAHILGMNSAQEMMSKKSTEVLDYFDVLNDDGTIADFAQIPTRKVFNGESVYDVMMHFRLKATGDERWSVVSARPVFDGEGNVAFVINIFRDVTQEKHAQETLRQNEERATLLAQISEKLGRSIDYQETLKNLAKSLVPALADWCAVDLLNKENDAFGGIERVAVHHINPEKIKYAEWLLKKYPYEPKEDDPLNQMIKSGKAVFYPQITDEMLVAAAKDEEYLRISRTLQFKSAISAPLIVRGKVIGRITLIMAESNRSYTKEDLSLAEDICRRAALAVDNARLYRNVQDALNLRDEFLSIASHELKTPVTSIKAFLQALQMRMQDPATFDFQKNAEYMQLSVKQVDRLAAIISDLLDINRINKGSMEYHFRHMSLGPVVAEVVERMSVSFPTHHIALKLQDLTTRVNIDILRFEQILTNLLTNAVKYSPEGSTIDVATRREDNHVLIEIADRGIGISSEDQKRIFDRYYRTQEAISTRASGLGIGLYIVHQLIKAHSGTLSVQSAVGKGSRFTISLPVVDVLNVDMSDVRP